MIRILYLFLVQFVLFNLPRTDSCNLGIIATEKESNLTSPDYPHSYPNNINCWWKIQASSDDKLIGVQVVFLSLEKSSYCIFDSLSFYDGSDNNSTELARMCGTHHSNVLSTGNSMLISFLSDESTSGSGFFLKIFEVQKCGGEITATSDIGYITSPGYPFTYFNNMTCTWIVSAENETDTVAAKIKYMLLDSRRYFAIDFSCSKDAVRFYNGNTTNDLELLGTFCYNIHQVVQSTKNVLTVEFRTDADFTNIGFNLSFTTKQEHDCNITMWAFPVASYIVSPGYPDAYYNDLDCYISISAPRGVIGLDIIDIDIEGSYPDCHNDSLTIYDGSSQQSELVTLCGNASQGPSVINATSNVMTLRFTTNSGIVGKGYRLKVTSIYHPPTTTLPPPCGSPSLNATTIPQYLHSPGYPFHYFNNELCTWTIFASDSDMMVRIVIMDASFEGSEGSEITKCSYDFVQVYEGLLGRGLPRFKWCDKSRPIIQSSGRFMTLQFVTDSSIFNYRGFKLKYFETAEPYICGGTLNVTSSARRLTSPNYPGQYSSNQDCKWTVYAPSNTNIKLTMLNMGLESSANCQYDYLEIYDGTSSSPGNDEMLCGSESATFVSSGNIISINFHSDESIQGSGFKIKIQAGTYDGCTQSAVSPVASYLDKYIKSPNYPFSIPKNADCTWTIDSDGSDYTVHLDVISSSLPYSDGCRDTYVEAFDGDDDSAKSLGRWCGAEEPIKTSTGQFMFLKFKSGYISNQGSFKIKYTHEFHLHSSYVNTGAIVGGIIGGVFALVILILIVGGIVSKRQKPIVTRVPDSAMYTVSQGTTVTPTGFAGPPSYTTATAGMGEAGGPPPYTWNQPPR